MKKRDYDDIMSNPRFSSGRYPKDQDWWYMSWFHDRWLNITTLAFPTGEEGRHGIPVHVMYIVNDS